MVTPGTLLGVGVVIAIHSFLAAIATRYFRVRLETQWGTAIYTLTFVPFVLLVSTLFLTGILNIGGDLGSKNAAVVVVILVPMALGASVDLLWMPRPDEYDLPDTAD